MGEAPGPAIDLTTPADAPSNPATSANVGSSTSPPIPVSASPITQVTSRDNDAPLTGAQIAHHHQLHNQKKGFWRNLFCCCFPSARSHEKQQNGTQKGYTGPLTKTKPVLPPFRPTEVLLKPQSPQHQGKKCLVLDLDETLLHSSFKPVANADFVIPVEIEGQVHNVYVLKRPGVDEFLRIMGEHFEIVIFTASLAKYADPVIDKLDIHNVVTYRLFRESCYYHKGNYVKDLSRLGRDPKTVIFIDNSPNSYMFQPENALPCSTWIDDPTDRELAEMTDFLIELSTCENVIESLQRAEQE